MTRSFLSIESFDPLKVDISFLESVSNQVPEQGYMDGPMAEHLATVTLKAADYCIDLLAQATLYLGHCDAQRKAIRSRAIKQMLSDKVPSTVAKEACADDEDYIRSTNDYNIALAWSTWLENKHDALLKTHHLCKDLIRKAEMLKDSSGWSPMDVLNSERPSRVFKEDSEEKIDRSTGKSGWKV